jgi:predicted metal-dependent enzyme (double-stranded beta helix superfamily)
VGHRARTTATPATLADLAADLDHAARGCRTDATRAEAVAGALRPYLGSADLLPPESREGDPSSYRQHLLHVTEDGALSLVALVWLPGQETPVHDHIAWCVVGVHEGQEHETRYSLDTDRLVVTESVVNPGGTVSVVVPPGDIHAVRNAGDGPAISLHVYGADLRRSGTSIRRCYDLPVA